ncbi:MAG TPA: serine/threonine-protein kinase [Phycisphaerales bacterium]|nr:serine/threonine-protein kinase [Phycisphaerales bacterium]HMP37893.1 serine/threonine-protein kinase [Phycisphaerales bacterium]
MTPNPLDPAEPAEPADWANPAEPSESADRSGPAGPDRLRSATDGGRELPGEGPSGSAGAGDPPRDSEPRRAGSDPTSRVDPRSGGLPRERPSSSFGVDPARAAGVPESVGPYRILRELGRGGMGVVYLGAREDVPLRRMVAIKLVHRGMAVGEVLERFEREREVLAALNHPNIARLLDVGSSAEGEPYLVMEHVEGEPIDDYCDARRLTIPERLALFRQVCAAVQHAHQNLVVHRDIKPRNILVTPEGVPKLLDFGIAKLINPALSSRLDAPTVTGLRLMTPEYASPEQVRGLAITTASDIYALGVVLFELLTGHRPYRLARRAYQEVERIICEEDPQLPSTAISRVERLDGEEAAPTDAAPIEDDDSVITPESVSRRRRERPRGLRRVLEGDLDNIVLMAMRKEPQRRYRSAEALAEDLDRHLRGMPVIARPDTLGYRAAKFVRRNRGAVAAAACVVLALALGLAAALWQARIAAQERDLAEARLVRLRALAGALVTEIAPQVRRIEGATAARRTILENASRVLEDLSVEAARHAEVGPDSAARHIELAQALLQLGEVAGGYRSDTFGEMAAGEALAQRAAEGFEAALAVDPGNVPAQRGLARALRNLADGRREAERHDEALSLLRRSNQVADALVAADRSDPRLLLDRAGLRLSLGDGWRAKARSLEDLRRLRHGDSPSDPGSEAARLDRTALDAERAALAAWEEALADHVELARHGGSVADDREARREHAVVLQRLAGATRRVDAGQSLRRLAEAAAILDALQRGDDRDSSVRLQRVLLRTELARTRCEAAPAAEPPSGAADQPGSAAGDGPGATPSRQSLLDQALADADLAVAEASRMVAADPDNTRAVVARIAAREARLLTLELRGEAAERTAEYERLIEDLPLTRRPALIARTARLHGIQRRVEGHPAQAVALLLLAVRAADRAAIRDATAPDAPPGAQLAVDAALARLALAEALLDAGRGTEARVEVATAIEALRDEGRAAAASTPPGAAPSAAFDRAARIAEAEALLARIDATRIDGR